MLFFANKIDLPDALDASEISKALQLERISDRPWTIVYVNRVPFRPDRFHICPRQEKQRADRRGAPRGHEVARREAAVMLVLHSQYTPAAPIRFKVYTRSRASI